MTNYEKVKEACVKANPSIMALEFGCEIILKKPFLYEHGTSPYNRSRVIDHVDNEVYFDGVKIIKSCFKSDIKKILGREIRLADVLLMLNHFSETNNLVELNPKYPAIALIGKIILMWNLRHDSLSWHAENKPEVIDFLAEIIR